jgi:5-methylcytosine-specific restriction protein A
MPSRAPRLCPWCRKATVGPCPCRPKPERLSAAKRGYGSKWQMASKAYLATHRVCKIQGPHCTQVATCVDHVVPPRTGRRRVGRVIRGRRQNKREVSATNEQHGPAN